MFHKERLFRKPSILWRIRTQEPELNNNLFKFTKDKVPNVALSELLEISIFHLRNADVSFWEIQTCIKVKNSNI